LIPLRRFSEQRRGNFNAWHDFWSFYRQVDKAAAPLGALSSFLVVAGCLFLGCVKETRKGIEMEKKETEWLLKGMHFEW